MACLIRSGPRRSGAPPASRRRSARVLLTSGSPSAPGSSKARSRLSASKRALRLDAAGDFPHRRITILVVLSGKECSMTRAQPPIPPAQKPWPVSLHTAPDTTAGEKLVPSGQPHEPSDPLAAEFGIRYWRRYGASLQAWRHASSARSSARRADRRDEALDRDHARLCVHASVAATVGTRTGCRAAETWRAASSAPAAAKQANQAL
jgi:hypothetical protein